MSIDNFSKRHGQWKQLSQEQREWINLRGLRGDDLRDIKVEFLAVWGFVIKRETIKQVIAESALPQFRQVTYYRCPGCRGMTNSKPCIVCTVKRIGEQEKSCRKQS